MRQRIVVTTVLIVIFSLLASACAPAGLVGGLAAAKVKEGLEEVQTQLDQANPNNTVLGKTEEKSANEAGTADTSAVTDVQINDTLAAYQGALTAVYEKVNPSVVNIQVQLPASAATSQGSPFGSPDGSQPQVPSGALGSGFVWDKLGHIVTNNHVVGEAERIQVVFPDGTIVEATLVGTDPDSDLAVIKVDMPADKLIPITVADSSQVKVGQLAIAIGNPYGLDGTMTVGIVSALGRQLPTGDGTGPSFSIPEIIQTDAPINPGNSGGVLVDAEGNLIGVTTAIESQSGANAGIGFVVPSANVMRVVPVLIEKGSYEHSWLGISAGTLVPDVAEAMSLAKDTRGVLVSEVVANGPAAEAGLKGSDKEATISGFPLPVGGDVITAVDSQPLKEMEDLITYLATQTTVGQVISLTVLRDGTEMTIDVTLAARPSSPVAALPQEQAPAAPQGEETPPQGEETTPQEPVQNKARLGILGLDLTSELAQSLELGMDKGILIIEVQPDGPADAAGLLGGTKEVDVNGETLLAGGDVITAVNGQAVNTVEELRAQLDAAGPGAKITLTIVRQSETLDLPVTLSK